MAKPKEICLEKMLSKLNSLQEHLDRARIEIGLYENRKDYDKGGITYEFYRLQECLDQAIDEAGLELHRVNAPRKSTPRVQRDVDPKKISKRAAISTLVWSNKTGYDPWSDQTDYDPEAY